MTAPKKVIIIGLGRFGNAVVETLWANGADVTVVDHDGQLVERVKSHCHAAFVADATDPQVLESVGARSMDAAIVTFGEAFESAALAVSALKNLNVTEIVARASTSRRADVLRAVGATRVIEIEREIGRRVAQEVLTPSANGLLDLAAQYRVVPWLAQGSVVGRALKDSGLRQEHGLNVIGVHPAGAKPNAKLMFPAPDYVIKAGDVCLLVAEESEMQRFLNSGQK